MGARTEALGWVGRSRRAEEGPDGGIKPVQHTHSLHPTAREPGECMISNHEEHRALQNQTLGPGVHSTLILVAGHRLQQEQEEQEEEEEGGR